MSQPFSDLQRRRRNAVGLHPAVAGPSVPRLDASRPAGAGRVLFFGWSMIVAAAIGASSPSGADGGAQTTNERMSAVLAITIGAGGFRHVVEARAGFRAPRMEAPSYLIGQKITAWRAFARLGVVVGLGLILLSAFSFEWLLRKRRGALLGAVAAAVLVVEFATGPPIQTWRTDWDQPHVAWLRDHPDGIVAHYPLPIEKEALELGATETWNVTRHGHPLFAILTGGSGAREEAIRIVASNVADPLAAGVLAAQKVRSSSSTTMSTGRSGARGSSTQPVSLPAAGPAGATTRVYAVDAPPADLDRVLLEQSSRIALARAIPPRNARYDDGFDAPSSSRMVESGAQ